MWCLRLLLITLSVLRVRHLWACWLLVAAHASTATTTLRDCLVRALFPGSSGAGAVAAASKRIVKIFHCQRLGGSQMQPYESNRSAAALPGRTLPRARRGLKSWTRCDSLVLSRRFSIRRSQSVTSVTTSVPLLFPLAIASQILPQAHCVLQRCSRLIAGATSLSA